MNNKIHISNKIKAALMAEEELQFTKSATTYRETSFNESKSLFEYIFYVFISVFVWIFVGLISSFQAGTIFMIFVFILFISSKNISTNNDPKRIKNYHFTNKRIILEKDNESFENIYFKDIKEILSNEEDYLLIIKHHNHIHRGHRNTHKLLDLKAYDNIDKFKELWLPHSDYHHIFYKRIQQFALDKNFQIDDFSSNISIKITGRINGNIAKFTISKLADLDNINVSVYIECANPYLEHLKITTESVSNSMSKLIGMQDIKIGNSRIDNRFVLQGNNKEFVKKIIDDRMGKELLKAFKSFQGKIIFGEKIKPKKQKSKAEKEDINILDEHLIDEYVEKREYQANKKSRLTYVKYNLNLEKYLENYTNNIINVFETMILLANKINQYSSK